MPPPEPFLVFTRKLDDLRIPYLVSGSVAATFYGEPRMTNDVDIVLFMEPGDIDRLAAAFPLEAFYCPPKEVLRIELGRQRRGHFNLIHHATGFKADIYLSGDDPLHAWALSRARKADLAGDVLTLAPPEYVILRKLQFYAEGKSPKHLRDIHRMLLVLDAALDRDALEERIREFGLEAEWAAAQSPPP